MISKKYRLNEHELRKVLSKKKPFFSYGVIANTLPNRLGYCRCAILLSSKQAKWSVNRNFFRRILYDLSRGSLDRESLDIVFVLKKWIILNYKDPQVREEFIRNIEFLWKTLVKKNIPK